MMEARTRLRLVETEQRMGSRGHFTDVKTEGSESSQSSGVDSSSPGCSSSSQPLWLQISLLPKHTPQLTQSFNAIYTSKSPDFIPPQKMRLSASSLLHTSGHLQQTPPEFHVHSGASSSTTSPRITPSLLTSLGAPLASSSSPSSSAGISERFRGGGAPAPPDLVDPPGMSPPLSPLSGRSWPT